MWFVKNNVSKLLFFRYFVSPTTLISVAFGRQLSTGANAQGRKE